MLSIRAPSYFAAYLLYLSSFHQLVHFVASYVHRADYVSCPILGGKNTSKFAGALVLLDWPSSTAWGCRQAKRVC